MAYYEGETLKQRIERGPLSIDETIDIGNQIALGLARAHEEDIIHRDIKPANIVITNRGEVKIVDFGLAKLSGWTKLTKEGTTLGTAAYMSPEQTRGEDTDHRTDIWSLGVLLYEMVTDQQPFGGDYEQAVLYSILNEDCEPLTGLRTGVPMGLERIVHKCLEKEPSKRYQHADELIVDLQHVREEITSPHSSTAKSFEKAPDKKRWQSFAVPIFILVVAIITVAGYFFMSPEVESRGRIPIAVADFVNRTNEKELDALSGLVVTALEQSRRLSVLTRSRMFDVLSQMEKQDVDRIDEAIGRQICQKENINALLIASVQKFGSLYSVDFKVIDPIKDEYLFASKEESQGQESIPSLIDNLAERVRRELKEQEEEIQVASRPVAEVTTPNLEAYQHYFKGEELINKLKFDEAQEEFSKAIAADSTFGLAYYRLAYAISWFMGSEQLQKETLQKALALMDRIPEKERYLVRAYEAQLRKGYGEGIAVLKEMQKVYPNDKEMLFNIGDWSAHSSQNDIAIQYFKKVLELDPAHIRSLEHLVSVYENQKKYEKADIVLRNALELAPENPVLLSHLGSLLQAQKRYSEASDVLDQALHLDSNNVTVLNVLGWSLLEQREYSESEEIFLKGLELNSSHPGMLNGLGRLKIISNDYNAAEKYYRKYLKAFSPGRWWGEAMLGQIELLRSNHLAAERHLLDARAIDSTNVYVHILLGYLYTEKEDFSLAKNFSQSALAIEPSFASDNLMGWVLVTGGLDIERGIESAKGALDSKPDRYSSGNDPNIYPFLALPEHTVGLAYLKKGQYQKALEYLEQAAEQVPERQAIQSDLRLAIQKLKEMTNR
jgi:serine/threonine protein kinase/Tfp pilus assembly protein PilF